MDKDRRPADDLLDVTRALLLVQGSILVATTVEALIVGAALHATGGPALMSGAAATVILVARSRLRAVRRWPRRAIYVVEGLTLATITVDTALAIVLAHALPPLVAILTQLVLPISVVALLRRSARAVPAPGLSQHVSALEVTS